MPLYNPIPSMTSSVAGISTSATQAQQETGTSTTVSVAPGTQHYHPSAAKGWVKANASGTATVSNNVSSVTDGGVGRVVVNWTTSFSTANYTATATAQKSTSLTDATTFICQQRDDTTASACHIDIIDSTGTAFADPSYTHVIAFGDL